MYQNTNSFTQLYILKSLFKSDFENSTSIDYLKQLQ